MSGLLPLLAVSLLAVTTFMLAVFVTRPELLATIAILAAFAAQTDLGVSVPVISRIPIVLLLVLAAKLKFDARRTNALAGDRFGVHLPTALIALLVAATIATSISPVVSAQAAAAAIALFYSAATIARFLPIADILDRIGRIAAVSVLASLVVAPVMPTAFVGARLAGLFRNPNTLGTLALVALATMPRRRLTLLGPPMILATVLSGSRSAGLGVLVVMLVRTRWNTARLLTAAVVVPLLATLTLSLAAPSSDSTELNTTTAAEGPAILRTKNNRSVQWEQGLADAREVFPHGSGFGTSEFEYSNSGLFLVVEAGVLALPIAAASIVLANEARYHTDRRVAALVISLFVQSQFEGWMYAFGAFQALVFWLVVIAASEDRRRTRSASRAGPVPAPLVGVGGLSDA